MARPRETKTPRAIWAKKLGLNDTMRRKLPDYVIARLEHCRSDEARRLILGRSEKA